MPSTFFYLIFSYISWKIFLLATDPILQRYSISSVFHLCSGLRQEVFITYFCNYLFSFHFIDSSPERWNINYSIELNVITDQMMYVSSTNSRLQFMDLLVCLSRRQGAVPASTSLGWSLSAWYSYCIFKWHTEWRGTAVMLLSQQSGQRSQDFLLVFFFFNCLLVGDFFVLYRQMLQSLTNFFSYCIVKCRNRICSKYLKNKCSDVFLTLHLLCRYEGKFYNVWVARWEKFIGSVQLQRVLSCKLLAIIVQTLLVFKAHSFLMQ